MGTLLPGVRESDDVVDLDAFGKLGFFRKSDGSAGVGFIDSAGYDGAIIVGEDGRVAGFALDDDLAEATAGDFWPVGVEFVAPVAGFRGATFDGELLEDVEGERGVFGGLGGGGGGRIIFANRIAMGRLFFGASGVVVRCWFIAIRVGENESNGGGDEGNDGGDTARAVGGAATGGAGFYGGHSCIILWFDEAFKELSLEGVGGEGVGEGGGDVAAGFDCVAGLSGVERRVSAEVEEGGEIMIDFKFIGARLAVDDALVGVAVREPVVEGDGAGGGDEDEIAGSEDGVEVVGVEETEAKLGGAVFADEVGDTAEVVYDKFLFGGAGEEQDEFAGELFAGAGFVGSPGGAAGGAEVAEEVLCAGRGWEIAADERIGSGAEVEGAAGDDGFGGFDGTGDGVDFMVRAFEESGARVGDAHENDGIGLVAADGEDEVGEFGRDIAEAGVGLGFREALDGGVVNRLRRLFVEGEETEDDLEAGESHAGDEEDLERHISEARRKNVALDTEADEREEEDKDTDGDGEGLRREFEHDAEPDSETESEEAEGIDDGAVADLGRERLDVGEGVVDGFAEVLEGF